eukprot:66379-Pelagomonas_calceolata.AAC.1
MLKRAVFPVNAGPQNFWLLAQAWTGATCLLIVFGLGSLVMREFVVDLRKRLRGVWNADALAEH